MDAMHALRERGAAPVAAGEDARRFRSWFAQLTARVARPVLASLLWVHPLDSRAALNGSALVRRQSALSTRDRTARVAAGAARPCSVGRSPVVKGRFTSGPS